MSTSNPFATDYVEPIQKTDYLKFTEGAHVFRILTPKEKVISYFVEYIDNADQTKTKIAYPDLGDGQLPTEKAKSIWGMLVYNYKTEQVQILELSANTIKKYLTSIIRGSFKTDFTQYDLQVTRKGKGMNDTEYQIASNDTAPLTPEIQKFVDSELQYFVLANLVSNSKDDKAVNRPN